MCAYFAWLGALVTRLPSLGERVSFLLLSHAVGGLIHVQICLSHFSRKVFEGRPESHKWVEMQLSGTMDIDCPRWLDWFHGGLQFQTEHHLVPRMPRHKLRRFRDQMTPRIVEFDGKVTDFACSQFHTCYRTDDGRLWLTGVRRHVGIGGVGDAESMLQHTPLEVPLTGTALEVCDFTLACGFDTSLAITNDGDVYEWDWDLEVRPYTPSVPAKLDDICVGWKHALAVFK